MEEHVNFFITAGARNCNLIPERLVQAFNPPLCYIHML
jgi:hypothetical protein